MTFKEIEKIIINNIKVLTNQSYSIFSGPLPLSSKKGISLTLKNADLGSWPSSCLVFTMTLRSNDRDELLDHATTLRKVFNHTLPEGVITEVPEQDFFIEGVKGAFKWSWESSFDLKATAIKK